MGTGGLYPTPKTHRDELASVVGDDASGVAVDEDQSREGLDLIRGPQLLEELKMKAEIAQMKRIFWWFSKSFPN